MPDQDMKELLGKLHASLQETKTVDVESAQVLRDLMGHIEEVLHRSHVPAIPRHHTLSEHLRESAEYFEASHPNVTALINNVIRTLSNIGI